MQLLQELHDKGFQVSVVNGNTLKIVPGSKLSPELTERLKAEKSRLITILLAEHSHHDYYDRYIAAAQSPNSIVAVLT